MPAECTHYFTGVIPALVDYPTPRLFCTNLPLEVTDSVLSVLFQQYVRPLSRSCTFRF